MVPDYTTRWSWTKPLVLKYNESLDFTSRNNLVTYIYISVAQKIGEIFQFSAHPNIHTVNSDLSTFVFAVNQLSLITRCYRQSKIDRKTLEYIVGGGQVQIFPSENRQSLFSLRPSICYYCQQFPLHFSIWIIILRGNVS